MRVERLPLVQQPLRLHDALLRPPYDPSGCRGTPGTPYGRGRPSPSRGRALRARPSLSRSRAATVRPDDVLSMLPIRRLSRARSDSGRPGSVG
ncbi:hypothetical protein SHKM778_56560 [Streptomyces sp. KM77-8]|uniref:Uncharacterized protein n=1 Tax=Streptomyces haneummycinicus TaxID=3074435 RepID=A0AAT9HPI0_9ACTN